MCDHQQTYSASSRYSRDSRTLSFILVCDDCGVEVRTICSQQYSPQFNPHGNDPYLRGSREAA